LKRPVQSLYRPDSFPELAGSSVVLASRDQASGNSGGTIEPGANHMAAFLIADIKVTDDKWVPAYAASVHDIVHKHGGKYLSRSGNVKTLEGGPSDISLVAIMTFPSAKHAEAFVADPYEVEA